MFAIQNQTTGKFLYGTDYRYHPPHQKTSLAQMLTYATLAQAKFDYISRRCGKDYRVVCLKSVQVKRVIDFNSAYGYEVFNEDWRENDGTEDSH